MGKRQYEADIAGVKLFGRCKMYGNCICGECANAPVNRQDAVTITRPDGVSETIKAPTIIPEDDEQPNSWRPAQYAAPRPRPARDIPTLPEPKKRAMPPMEQQNRKRCPDCDVLLRSDHKCKARGDRRNGEVFSSKPAPAPTPPPAPEPEVTTRQQKVIFTDDFDQLLMDITIGQIHIKISGIK